MVCGRLRVKLVRVRSHGDITERKLEVTAIDVVPLDVFIVKMIQLMSWPLQGLPHPSAIISLIEKQTNVLMSASTKQTVIMCR